MSEKAVLIVIDVQGKLAQLMHDRERLFENLSRLVKGAGILGIPVLLTEQNPEALGPTIPEVAHLLPDAQPVGKTSFSCCGSDRFNRSLEALKRRQVLLAGIETHICVYQTAADLTGSGYDVQVVADAVASRTAQNKGIGLQKIRDAGAGVTGTETALFELLKVAEGKQFREILKIVK